MKRKQHVLLLCLLPAALILPGACRNPLRSVNGETGNGVHIDRDAANGATTVTLLINEFVFNHTGSDSHEYVELTGNPGMDFHHCSILQIEGDSGSTMGRIDSVTPVGETNAEGLFVTPFSENRFENGTTTILVVQNFTGATGMDLDLNDDGILDLTPWSSETDAIAVNDGGAGDHTYCSFVLSPNFCGGSFTVGGASRIPGIQDDGLVNDWIRNDFDGMGLPGFIGTPDAGEALNTPGTENRLANPAQPRALTIPQIQGSGHRSPRDGELVVTSGVVTLLSADGRSFWMQDPEGDGNPATSDGIYVYRGAEGRSIQTGDHILLTGSVNEYTAAAHNLPLTELSGVRDVKTLSAGNPLPDAVQINSLPGLSVPDAILRWESLEGMLVTVTGAPVVGATSAYGEFVILAHGNARPGEGYFPMSRHVVLRVTREGEVDYNPERIIVDDGTLAEPITVAPGDRVRRVSGVVDYSFGNYKIQPATVELFPQHHAGPPIRRRRRTHREIAITNFNVENLFDLLDDPTKNDSASTPTPQQLETKLDKLTLAVIQELQLPQIMVIEEVENQQILQELGDRVNRTVDTRYRAVSFESSDRRGIEVGFLFDENRVSLITAHQMSGPDVEKAFGPSSGSPGREPIVGVFRIGRADITVIGNHFKSKGGDGPIFGTIWPPPRPSEEHRKAQARVVRNFVDRLFAEQPRALVVVTGDLNDFQFGEPGEGPNHPLAILEGKGRRVPLVNLINTVPEAERWTYVYDGNSQVLDHVLVSPRMLPLVSGVEILHFNAGYPAILSEDRTTPLHSSDHDAVELRLKLHSRG